MEQARQIELENDSEVTRISNPEFWYLYQQAILLALKTEGILNEMQYRYAEEKLKTQRRSKN